MNLLKKQYFMTDLHWEDKDDTASCLRKHVCRFHFIYRKVHMKYYFQGNKSNFFFPFHSTVTRGKLTFQVLHKTQEKGICSKAVNKK